ncbi:mitochondrial substrate carrier family protein S-like [Watersipora subatra]|uniref:mitochondrial substrate carrier family protein S-like n=1 Tax=Watersipora subatra TaxID=2589382 RepID=UPI00355C7680
MHNERRTHWVKDGIIGLGVGVLYGTTNVMVGHPFDTIKTKMQAQKGFENYSMVRTLTSTIKQQGIKGLYRGCVPPLWGSGIYRSMQFAVFEAGYTHLNTAFGTQEIPGTGGLQVRVILSGVMASTVRATIECPLEYAKVRGQLGHSWTLRSVYTGYGVTWIRTVGLMTSYFMMVDTIRRQFPDQFNRPLLGPFLTSGCAATFAWWIVWPFEVMKSQIQGGYGDQKLSLVQRLQFTIKERGGLLGLYRGIGPGTIRSFLANGTSMIVMVNAQKQITKRGWRENGVTLDEES